MRVYTLKEAVRFPIPPGVDCCEQCKTDVSSNNLVRPPPDLLPISEMIKTDRIPSSSSDILYTDKSVSASAAELRNTTALQILLAIIAVKCSTKRPT